MMYLLFKALHLIAMVTWFAGLFYMFRLFVYIVENKEKAETKDLLKLMAHRLYFYITYPAGVATLIFGLSLLSQTPETVRAPWFVAKVLLLLGLIGYHLFIGYTLKQFKGDNYYLNSRQCRMLNEVPIVFLVSIVFLAVYKQLPF